MGWLSRRRRRTAVIGAQIAAAVAAEERHQQVSRLPSPLLGLTYQLERGEYDLFRFVESETDELVALTALRALELRRQELVEFRDALTQDDFYTLLTFARRVAVRVLRGHADQLSAGWAAVGIVDLERVDWRDAAVAVGLLGYCAARTDTHLRAAVSRALTIALDCLVSKRALSSDSLDTLTRAETLGGELG